MTWITNEETFCNFIAPEDKAGSTGSYEVLFPLSENTTPAPDSNVVDITVEQMSTIAKVTALSADATLNLDAHQQVTAGALLAVVFAANSGGPRKVTIGTGINGAAATYTMPASGKLTLVFVYNGTDFDLISAAHNTVSEVPDADSQTPVYGATIAATIKARHTVITVGTLTGALTLNLTVNACVKAGATLIVKTTCDGTNRTTTWGTGFTAPALIGTASKTVHSCFIFDGVQFVLTGTPIQID